MVHDGTDVPEAGEPGLGPVVFDEQRLVSNAGLLVTSTLADGWGSRRW